MSTAALMCWVPTGGMEKRAFRQGLLESVRPWATRSSIIRGQDPETYIDDKPRR